MISKLYNIRGDMMRGQIRLRLVRDGAAVAVYLPAGMNVGGFPEILTGTTEELRVACDKIKADFQLVEA